MTDLKVDVTNLKKNYGSNQVLKGIDFKVANNEVVVLIGLLALPNSTGASMIFSPTLKLLNKLKCWNTIPIFSRALSIFVLGSPDLGA